MPNHVELDYYQIVEVLWRDAYSRASEWEAEVDSSTMPTVSVGYLVHDDEDSLTIVTIVNENHMGNGLSIPRGCVEKVRKL